MIISFSTLVRNWSPFSFSKNISNFTMIRFQYSELGCDVNIFNGVGDLEREFLKAIVKLQMGSAVKGEGIPLGTIHRNQRKS